MEPELDSIEGERVRALEERLKRHPWATWTIAASLAAMFALEVSLGGAEDPWLLIRLGALAPDRVYAGEWWRLISSAFLHAGFMHFALNTGVLLVIGSSLERIIGSARFLTAYALSVLAASAAALTLSDARLTVGASGGVFGLFGVEAIVVVLRRDLLPDDVQARRTRGVVINLLVNIANSFRPHIAMAAHFGGGLAGAVIGFVLVPHSFAEDRHGPAVWVRVAAAVGALMLAAGLATALHHAYAGGWASAPTLQRAAIPGITEPTATAELPAGLAPSTEHPGMFGDLTRDPGVVSVSRLEDLRQPPSEGLTFELQNMAQPDHMSFQGAREESLGGRHAAVASYEGREAPLILERVIVREQTSAWIVEAVFWAALRESWAGVASRIATSIVEDPLPMGDRVALLCDRWAAHLPPGSTTEPLVSGPAGASVCGEPAGEISFATRGVTGMIGHLAVSLDPCRIDVHAHDVPVSRLRPDAQHPPPEGEPFAFEVGEISGTQALRVISSDAALVLLFRTNGPERCADVLSRVRDTIRRSIEETPLLGGGEVEAALDASGLALGLTLPPGWILVSLGRALPDASGAISYDVAYELHPPTGEARGVLVSDAVERGRVRHRLLPPDAEWTDTPDASHPGESCRSVGVHVEAERRVSFHLCGPPAERAAVRTVLETAHLLPRAR